MEDLKSLFVILLLFISISIIIGIASLLIAPKIAGYILGSLLILSSISIISIFINSFVFNKKEVE